MAQTSQKKYIVRAVQQGRPFSFEGNPMTTTVKVMTHLWPVEATRVDPETGAPIIGPETVQPHSNVTFYLSNSQALVLKELPAPENPLQPQPTTQQPEAVQ